MRKSVMVFMVMLVAAFTAVAGEFPKVGEPAPSFQLTSDEGKQVKLEDLKGKWVVLYFYPKDFTSGCTLEAHNFQRDIDQYKSRDAVIVGVSVDTADSHKNFCAKEGLSFRLLSDPDASVSKAYNSLTDMAVAKYSARNTFLIDPTGKLARVFAGVKPAGHSEEVIAALDELRKAR
jgi:thioredoxin-dependent peroxiredoxin